MLVVQIAIEPGLYGRPDAPEPYRCKNWTPERDAPAGVFGPP